MGRQPQFGRPDANGTVGREGERRRTKGDGIDAQNEVVHDRVADQRDLVDVDRLQAGLVGEAQDERPQRGPDRAGHLEPAAVVHHRVRDATHEVLAEPDLWVHDARRGEDRAVAEIGEVAGDGGRADVDRDAVDLLVKARPDRGHVATVVDRHGHGVAAPLERRLEGPDHVEVGDEVGQAPLALERLEQPDEVARRRRELGRRDLDIVEAHDRVDHEVPDGQVLADHLAVDLAVGRDVDDHVAAQVRGARQPPAVGETALAVVLGLVARPGRSGASGLDVMPCLANVPNEGSTWHRPHSPRPPQTESMSTPSARAASRTVVPASNRPRRPDGVKMTSGSAGVAADGDMVALILSRRGRRAGGSRDDG